MILKPHACEVLVQGGKFFPKHTRACLSGSTFGGSRLKMGWVGLGLHVEFHDGVEPDESTGAATRRGSGCRSTARHALGSAEMGGCHQARPGRPVLPGVQVEGWVEDARRCVRPRSTAWSGSKGPRAYRRVVLGVSRARERRGVPTKPAGGIGGNDRLAAHPPMATSASTVRTYHTPSTRAGEARVRVPMSLVCRSSNSGPVFSRLLKKSAKRDRQIDPDVLPCSQHC